MVIEATNKQLMPRLPEPNVVLKLNREIQSQHYGQSNLQQNIPLNHKSLAQMIHMQRGPQAL